MLTVKLPRVDGYRGWSHPLIELVAAPCEGPLGGVPKGVGNQVRRSHWAGFQRVTQSQFGSVGHQRSQLGHDAKRLGN